MVEFSFLNIILSIILSYIIYNLIVLNKKTNRFGSIPNGPFALPFLGNLLLNISKSQHLVLDKVSKKYGKIYRLWKADLFCIVTSDIKFINEINDSGNFNGKPLQPSFKYSSLLFNDIVYTSTSNKWKRNKELLISSLSKINYNEINKHQINELIMSFQYHNNNLISPKLYLKKLILNIFFEISFNKKYSFENVVNEDSKFYKFFRNLEKKGKFIDKHLGDYSKILISKFEKFFQSEKGQSYINGNLQLVKDELNKNLNTSMVDNYNIINNLIQEFKLINNDNNGELKDEDKESIHGIILNLLEYGINEISNTLEFILLELINNSLNNPQDKENNLQDILYKEIKNLNIEKDQFISYENNNKTPLLNSFIKEVMRIHPIHPLIYKRCTRNTKIKKYYFEKDTCIIINYKSINNDNDNFKNANQFKFDRFINNESFSNLMNYGFGKRRCPGDKISDILIYTTTANIINNFILSSKDNKEIIYKEFYNLTSFPSQYEMIIKNR